MFTRDELIALGIEEATASKLIREIAGKKVALLAQYVAKDEYDKVKSDLDTLKSEQPDETKVAELEAKVISLTDELFATKNEHSLKELLGKQEKKPLEKALSYVLADLKEKGLKTDENGIIDEADFKTKYDEIVTEKDFFFGDDEEKDETLAGRIVGNEPPKSSPKAPKDEIETFLSPMFSSK